MRSSIQPAGAARDSRSSCSACVIVYLITSDDDDGGGGDGRARVAGGRRHRATSTPGALGDDVIADGQARGASSGRPPASRCPTPSASPSQLAGTALTPAFADGRADPHRRPRAASAAPGPRSPRASRPSRVQHRLRRRRRRPRHPRRPGQPLPRRADPVRRPARGGRPDPVGHRRAGSSCSPTSRCSTCRPGTLPPRRSRQPVRPGDSPTRQPRRARSSSSLAVDTDRRREGRSSLDRVPAHALYLSRVRSTTTATRRAGRATPGRTSAPSSPRKRPTPSAGPTPTEEEPPCATRRSSSSTAGEDARRAAPRRVADDSARSRRSSPCTRVGSVGEVLESEGPFDVLVAGPEPRHPVRPGPPAADPRGAAGA